MPEDAILSSLINTCIAQSMYQIAEGVIKSPVYVGNEPGQVFCRCIGGPAWFGYERFNPMLPGLMSTGSTDAMQAGKHLKKNEDIACETYRSVGDIKPLGRYVVIRRCDEINEDPGVKCIVCFAGGEEIRDLCALAHFSSHDVFNLISFPWGPACSTMVTYPAGMVGNSGSARINLGPTDPSARSWMPENYLVMGIPVGIARKMAEDVGRSFLAEKKKCLIM
ncbi:MAG: DUF169 domain-containing protein [Methanothrix sp.]|nr:DUF169 domain-containing protein [Methanothrix sp.]